MSDVAVRGVPVTAEGTRWSLSVHARCLEEFEELLGELRKIPHAGRLKFRSGARFAAAVLAVGDGEVTLFAPYGLAEDSVLSDGQRAVRDLVEGRVQ